MAISALMTSLRIVDGLRGCLLTKGREAQRAPEVLRSSIGHRPRRNGTTVDEVLTRELEDVACAHAEELAVLLAGLRRPWPGRDAPLLSFSPMTVQAAYGQPGCSENRLRGLVQNIVNRLIRQVCEPVFTKVVQMLSEYLLRVALGTVPKRARALESERIAGQC
jgi:hypothetical protein